MKSMKKGKPEQPDQSTKFIQTAKEHGCDESENAFAEKLKKLAEPKKKTTEKG
ncbi:MAG: hypothetical protein V1721_07120 [Pseudomonadota bacterium]